MKKLLKYIVISTSCLLVSCASIPASTTTLTREVIKESDDMHQLNIALVNKLFGERKERIDLFIKNVYTPEVIKNYEKLLPNTVNYKDEMPNIIKSIIPVINKRKDSLQAILSQQKQQILNDLNTNYKTFQTATTSLQNLIESVVKIKSVENKALHSIEKLTGTSLDAQKVKTTIDKLLNETAPTINKLVNIENILKE